MKSNFKISHNFYFYTKLTILFNSSAMCYKERKDDTCGSFRYKVCPSKNK